MNRPHQPRAARRRARRPAFVLALLLGVVAAPPTSGARGGATLERAGWQLPAPVAREVVVTDGRHLYVAGGLDVTGVSSAAVLEIAPRSGRATRVGSLASGVHDAMGAWRDGALMVVGGGTPPVRADVQVLEPGRWPAASVARVVGRVPQPRADHAVARVGRAIYVLGGGDEASQLVGTVAVTRDGGATWRDAGTLAEAVRYPAVAVVGHAVYLFGGVVGSGGTDTTAVQRYDPTTGRTAVVAHLPAPLSHATALAFGDHVYLFGGYVDNRLGAQVWRFDARRRVVRDTGLVLPTPLSDAAGVVIDGVGYVVGGQGPDRLPTAAVARFRPPSPSQ